jgi:hypothetical protein
MPPLLRVRFGDITLVLVFDVAVGLHVDRVDAVVGVERGERERTHYAQARQRIVIVSARSVTVAPMRAGHAAEPY